MINLIIIYLTSGTFCFNLCTYTPSERFFQSIAEREITHGADRNAGIYHQSLPNRKFYDGGGKYRL